MNYGDLFNYGLRIAEDSKKFDEVIRDYGADGKVWFNKDFIKNYEKNFLSLFRMPILWITIIIFSIRRA